MGFGRKHGDLAAAPVQQGPLSSFAPIERDWDESEGNVSLSTVFLCLAGALFAVLLIDSMLAGTALITPINRVFLNTMRAIGFAIGLAVGLALGRNPFYGMIPRIKLAIYILCAGGGGLAFNSVAWRLADLMEFGLSDAPYHQASYPVTFTKASEYGARDVIEIDPYGTWDGPRIAIPHEQYQSYLGGVVIGCVAVMQRRSASGAIEIVTDGAYTLNPPKPAVIAPCPSEDDAT